MVAAGLDQNSYSRLSEVVSKISSDLATQEKLLNFVVQSALLEPYPLYQVFVLPNFCVLISVVLSPRSNSFATEAA